MASMDCSTPTLNGEVKSATVRFTQVLGANLVLGASKKVSKIVREGANE